MAEIVESGGGHEKGGKKRPKKGSPRVDMTPMVDLAFLLLTFFVMTSTFSKPTIMSLVYPAKPKPDQPAPPPSEINTAITFLLSEDQIFYYEGEFFAPGNPKGKPATQLSETTFGPDGVRKLLADKNSYVLNAMTDLDGKLKRGEIADTTYTRLLIDKKGDRLALKVLIKTDLKASCKNFIDLIDELKINNIGVIAPVDMMKSEETLLNQTLGK